MNPHQMMLSECDTFCRRLKSSNERNAKECWSYSDKMLAFLWQHIVVVWMCAFGCGLFQRTNYRKHTYNLFLSPCVCVGRILLLAYLLNVKWQNWEMKINKIILFKVCFRCHFSALYLPFVWRCIVLVSRCSVCVLVPHFNRRSFETNQRIFLFARFGIN